MFSEFKKLSPKNTFNHFPITDSSLFYSVARPRLCIFCHQAWDKSSVKELMTGEIEKTRNLGFIS
jgi:hypothetical protein